MMIKRVRTNGYNYDFNYETGFFARWGKDFENDPDFSPLGPEILDLEATTICKGPGGKLCHFCYKSNSPNGKNMSFDTFKKILDKMPNNLTQVAFGVDAQCESNPDIWKMMDYCRNNEKNKIIPNITVADISDEVADKLVKYCGAVAVSRYAEKDICYNSVKKLTDRGLKQTNIHIMISQETIDQAYETINDYHNDERLKGLNAIVFLSLKKKGRGEKFNPLTQEQFKELVDFAMNSKTPIGFDSCSADKFIKSIKGHKNEKHLTMCTEPCESFGMFSSYVNVDGIYFPCSFCENSHPDFMKGFNVAECNDFIEDIWNSPLIKEWRDRMTDRRNGGNFSCPIFEV